MVIFILPNTYKPDQSIAARLRRVDWLGSVLFVGSLTSFLVALSWVGDIDTLFTPMGRFVLIQYWEGWCHVCVVDLAYHRAPGSGYRWPGILGGIFSLRDSSSYDPHHDSKGQIDGHQLLLHGDPRHVCEYNGGCGFRYL